MYIYYGEFGTCLEAIACNPYLCPGYIFFSRVDPRQANNYSTWNELSGIRVNRSIEKRPRVEFKQTKHADTGTVAETFFPQMNKNESIKREHVVAMTRYSIIVFRASILGKNLPNNEQLRAVFFTLSHCYLHAAQKEWTAFISVSIFTPVVFHESNPT